MVMGTLFQYISFIQGMSHEHVAVKRNIEFVLCLAYDPYRTLFFVGSVREVPVPKVSLNTVYPIEACRSLSLL